jgi:hypothetical protein
VVSRRACVIAVAAAAACARSNTGKPMDGPKIGDGRMPDAHRDGRDMDDGRMPDAGGPQNHLLLSEICLGPDGEEFVEIANPTSASVDLSHYYLANHGSYFKLPAGSPTLPLDHFIVRFPAGATIAPAGVITVATLSASSFQSAFGVAPTYSIADGTMTTIDMPGGSTPHLTDTGAFVVLFEWDGTTALVRDVDMMLAGNPVSPNTLISKSGYSQLGFTYGMDANTIPSHQSNTPPLGASTKRLSLEAGHETQAGVGNGLTGHDETSEQTGATWDQSNFGSPTPNTAPAAIL